MKYKSFLAALILIPVIACATYFFMHNLNDKQINPTEIYILEKNDNKFVLDLNKINTKDIILKNLTSLTYPIHILIDLKRKKSGEAAYFNGNFNCKPHCNSNFKLPIDESIFSTELLTLTFECETKNIYIQKNNDNSTIEIGELTKFNINNTDFQFIDSHSASYAANAIKNEIITGDYKIDNFQVKAGDVMIDIGAHIGMISILYAKLYPKLTVYAFEPVPDNYTALLKNIELNNVTNVIPFNMTVTKDGRDITITANFDGNTGSSTQFATDEEKNEYDNFSVKSITLENIFKKHNIKKCKLLKIDCEGSEYEILMNTPDKIFKKIENLVGEFHSSENFLAQGLWPEQLEIYCIVKGHKDLQIKVSKVRLGIKQKGPN